MTLKNKSAIYMAILAAALYGVSTPLSKLLLLRIPPAFMAALLYLGAGIGMLIVTALQHLGPTRQREARISKKDLPYVVGMIVLDIVAPILLMIGLTMASAESTSLLNNFEIVATSLIALVVFKEAIGKRMWLAIVLITAASILLSIDVIGTFKLSMGSVFVLLAGISWGIENNCTRMLSLKDPLQIVVIKGMGSGIGALIIAFASNDVHGSLRYIVLALFLGFVAYGLSIYFYIKAQRELGAARTSAYYAVAPFIGVLLSWLVFQDRISYTFLIALLIMALGSYFAVTEKHEHSHIHMESIHEHMHNHLDGHHMHSHDIEIVGEHSHEHAHTEISHRHSHTPDMHHRHKHK